MPTRPGIDPLQRQRNTFPNWKACFCRLHFLQGEFLLCVLKKRARNACHERVSSSNWSCLSSSTHPRFPWRMGQRLLALRYMLLFGLCLMLVHMSAAGSCSHFLMHGVATALEFLPRLCCDCLWRPLMHARLDSLGFLHMYQHLLQHCLCGPLALPVWTTDSNLPVATTRSNTP